MNERGKLRGTSWNDRGNDVQEECLVMGTKMKSSKVYDGVFFRLDSPFAFQRVSVRCYLFIKADGL